jgi:hypothetical protein
MPAPNSIGRAGEHCGYPVSAAETSLGDVERLLRAVDRLAVATGVASIWRYRAAELAAGHARLHGGYGHRFLLGLGVSDAAAARGADAAYRPLAALGGHLDELDQAPDPLPAGERVARRWARN